MSTDPVRIYRRGGADEPVSIRGTVELQAEVDWLVEGPADALSALCESLPTRVAEPFGPLLLLRFGNAVGEFEHPLGRFSVRSGKWSSDDYDAMLGAISRHAAALPFAAGAASAMPFARDALHSTDVLYHAFVYLRYALGAAAPRSDAVRPAIGGILRRPHRRFRRQGRVVPLELARRVEPSTLVDVLQQRWPWRRAGLDEGPLARRLDGYLPLEIEESVAHDTVDTAENRFVKAFLARCTQIVDRMRVRAMAARKAFRDELLRDCTRLDNTLRPLRQHAMWQEVGRMRSLPVASTVLQGRPTYRTVFDAWGRLHLGSSLPLDERDAAALLEVKDIALLYEVWCCYGLVDAVRAAKDEPPSHIERRKVSPFQVTVPWNWKASWPDGTEVTYNPQFSRSNSAKRRSWSVSLRPDLALEVSTGANAGLHLFDAKFKLDWISALTQDDADNEEEEQLHQEERRSVFKRADLYKMHAYRDAIPQARSAWVLYPGSTSRLHSQEEEEVRTDFSDLPAVITGVGGVPMPGGAVAPDLVRLVGRLVG